VWDWIVKLRFALPLGGLSGRQTFKLCVCSDSVKPRTVELEDLGVQKVFHDSLLSGARDVKDYNERREASLL